MLRFETYFVLILAVHAPISIVVTKEFADDEKEIIKSTEYDLITTIPQKRLWVDGVIRAFLMNR